MTRRNSSVEVSPGVPAKTNVPLKPDCVMSSIFTPRSRAPNLIEWTPRASVV
jgi:hypothetical protein